MTICCQSLVTSPVEIEANTRSVYNIQAEHELRGQLSINCEAYFDVCTKLKIYM